MMILVLFGLALLLAFANGGNDVSKGIATLVGSGVSNYRRAVLWGALWTVAGGLASAMVSEKLVRAFSGSGLLSVMPEGHGFLAAAAAGALGWVLLATRTGLPVSTTHAITGALCGAGMMAGGADGVKWAVIGQKFALPLAVSPLLSLTLMWLLFPLVRFCFARLNKYCVCVEKVESAAGHVAVASVPAASSVASEAQAATADALVVGESQVCAASPNVISRLNLMDSLHWVSAGATSFARGLNDAPKILALGVVAGAALGVSSGLFYALVALAMGVGSRVAGLRVTETLAQRVTPMNPTEGFAANLVTACLVIFASRFGLPVSTTHVSSGAIIGIGLRRGGLDVRWKVVRDMLLAWCVTLPATAMLAAAACWLMT